MAPRKALPLGAALLAGAALALAPLKVGAGLTLAGIVVAGSVVCPQLCILLLIPAVPFGELVQVSLGGAKAGPTEALLAVALMAWLVQVAASRKLRFASLPLALIALLFLSTLLLSILNAESLSLAAVEILKWLETCAVAALVARLFNERWTKAVLVACLVTGGVAGLHGIYQFWSGSGPEGFVLLDRFKRAYGTFAQPNPYGGYLGLTLPLAVGLALTSLAGKNERAGLRWTVGAAVSGGLMFAGLIMSWSRGAWLGFASAVAAIAVLTAARLGRKALVALVLVFVVGAGAIAGGWLSLPSSISERLGDLSPSMGPQDVTGVEITDENYAVVERIAHWQAALGMWTEHPWSGVGIGNYEAAYERYALPMWPDALGHAHNYYLNMGAEAGLLGLGAFVMLLAAAGAVAWKATQRTYGWRWGLAAGTVGVLAHFAVHSMVDSLFVHGMYLQLGILVGVALRHESG